LRCTALTVRSEAFYPVAFLAPFLGIGFNLTGERIVRIILANGGQVTGGVTVRVVKRRIVDIPRKKRRPFSGFELRDHVDFVAAFTAKAGRIQTMTGRVGVLELSLEKDVARSRRQRREDFTCAGNEPVQLERKKGCHSRATTFLFRETYAGKESFEALLASFCFDAAISCKQCDGFIERDGLLALQLLPVIQPNRQLSPDR
jgi:hypothetical protein